MKVKRMYEKEVKEFKVGDQIKVGKYTATAVRKDGKGMMFLLDQYLDKAYTHENLIEEMNKDLAKDKNFKEISEYLVPEKFGESEYSFRVLYAGEMFPRNGEDWADAQRWYEPDCANGKFYACLECMKDRKNRIADRKGNYEWGWLMNKCKASASYFAFVSYTGPSNHYGASNALGVRPAFWLAN